MELVELSCQKLIIITIKKYRTKARKLNCTTQVSNESKTPTKQHRKGRESRHGLKGVAADMDTSKGKLCEQTETHMKS